MATYSVKDSEKKYTLRLTLEAGEYNSASNSSPVSYKLELISNGSYQFKDYSIGSRITIGGKSVHSQAKVETKKYEIQPNGTLSFASGTTTVIHDADGSKTLTFLFMIDMTKASNTPGTLSRTGTLELSGTPRKATITSAPTSFKDTDTPQIAFSNPGGFDIKPFLYVYKDSNDTVPIYRKIYNQDNYSSPFRFELEEGDKLSLLRVANEKNSYTVRFGITTPLSSGNEADYKISTLNIVDANPTYSDSYISYADTNKATYDKTGNPLNIVSMVSKVSVTYGAATPKKGAYITKYDVSLGGVTKTIKEAGGGTVEFKGVTSDVNQTLFVTAYDSRGNYTTVQKNVTMIPYSEPKIAPYPGLKYVDCYRCTEGGVRDKSGAYLKVEAQKQWSALNNLSNSCKLQVKVVGSKDWITLDTTDTAGTSANKYVSSGKFSGVVPGVVLNLAKGYTVSVRAFDDFEKASATFSIKIPTQDVDLHLKNGVAVGEYVTESSTLKLSYSWKAHGLYGLAKCEEAVSTDANIFKAKFKIYAVSADITTNGKNWPEKGSLGLLVVYSADGSGNTTALYPDTWCKIGQRFMSATSGKEYVRILSHAYNDNSWTYGEWIER